MYCEKNLVGSNYLSKRLKRIVFEKMQKKIEKHFTQKVVLLCIPNVFSFNQL